MAVNRIAEGYVKQPKVRFPSEFNALYDKPREYFMGGARPATMTISYPIEIPSQLYHQELRNAQRKYDFETIASRRHFDHTTFREPRPGRVITNPINNGQRPFQTSVSGTISPLHTYPGGLGTFVYNQHHLRGGVLSSIEGQKYARDILDRRASQIRQMENPEVPPPSDNRVMTGEDSDKLELYGLLNEVIDNVGTGNYSDLVFGNIRKLTALLIKTAPTLETEDFQDIYIAVKDAVLAERSSATMAEHHGSVPAPSFLSERRQDEKFGLIYRNLEKLLGFMEELIAGDIGNLSEIDRRTLVKTAMKHWKLSSISTVAPRALGMENVARRQPPAGIPPVNVSDRPLTEEEEYYASIPRSSAERVLGQIRPGSDFSPSSYQEIPQPRQATRPDFIEPAPATAEESRPKKTDTQAVMALRSLLASLYNADDVEGMRQVARRLKFFNANAIMANQSKEDIRNRFNKYYSSARL